MRAGTGKWRDREASRGADGAAPPAAERPPAPAASRGPPMERTDSNERPSGPPRLNLAGNRPSWRDREAAKAAGGAAPERDANAPAPRTFSGRGPPMTRTDSGRGENGRDESPAPPKDSLTASGAPGKYVPKFRRDAAN